MELAWVLDCSDPDRLAGFWSAALGYERGPLHDPYVGLRDPAGRLPAMLLQRVPEPKNGKNRMHLDLRVPELGPPMERLTALGARCLRGPFDDRGWLTAVMADPEGNEFCLIVPPEGRRA
jgi:predicted enzyme related to lactoylglutathione lyase